MSWQSRFMLLLMGALVAGHALHWFISGSSSTHTAIRNAMVGVQLAVGVAVMLWAWIASTSKA